MTKRFKKRRLGKPPLMDYAFEVGDGNGSYSFQSRMKGSTTNLDSYNEFTQLMIYGHPTQPVYKNVYKVLICLWSEPELDDHRAEELSAKAHSTVGHMNALRDKITLDVSCFIPPRMFNNILVSLAAGKIRIAQVYGEKLRWGRGGMMILIRQKKLIFFLTIKLKELMRYKPVGW